MTILNLHISCQCLRYNITCLTVCYVGVIFNFIVLYNIIRRHIKLFPHHRQKQNHIAHKRCDYFTIAVDVVDLLNSEVIFSAYIEFIQPSSLNSSGCRSLVSTYSLLACRSSTWLVLSSKSCAQLAYYFSAAHYHHHWSHHHHCFPAQHYHTHRCHCALELDASKMFQH